MNGYNQPIYVQKSGSGALYGVAAIALIGVGLIVWYLMKKPIPPPEKINPKGSITW